jgi:hypothetical protein
MGCFDFAWLQPLNEPVACRSGSSFKVITLRFAQVPAFQKYKRFRFMGSCVCSQADIHRDQKIFLCQDHAQRCRGYRIDTNRRFEIGETLQRLEGNSVFETSFTGALCTLKEFARFITMREKARLSLGRHQRQVIHFARLIALDSILTKHHAHSIEF